MIGRNMNVLGCAITATFDRGALKSGEPFAAVPTRA
jgi:hypothetical protein